MGEPKATRRFPRHTPFALLLCAIAIVVALHALRPDVDPALDYVSQYGNEEWSWLFGVALVICALGLLSLGALLREVGDSRAGPKLMRVSAMLLGLVAVFPSDRRDEAAAASLSGYIHGTAAIAAFSALTVAVAMISLRAGAHGTGAAPRLPSGRVLPLALGALVIGAVSVALVPEAHGLRQRVFLVVVFGWLLLTAHQVRSHVHRETPLESGSAPGGVMRGTCG